MAKLLIHPRRGLFQLTKCDDCGHMFECENCTAKLTTYRRTSYVLELVCHQCQSYYNYPPKCSKCGSNKVSSLFSGIDDLSGTVEKDLEQKTVRLDKAPYNWDLFEHNKDDVFLTTRIFDPSIEYDKFSHIIFIQAENLLASPDYQVQEEVNKSLMEIFLQVNSDTEIVFDTNSKENTFFEDLIKLNKDYPKNINSLNWFKNQIEKEIKNRKDFSFPPFENLILMTTQEKKLDLSISKLKAAKDYLEKEKIELNKIRLSDIYPARFLKRKGFYSHHLLVKFPKNYDKFQRLQKDILGLKELYRLQIRLNPRHLF
jgi:primosomal protein N' (replication factor Y)